jgi:hypothetical protein
MDPFFKYKPYNWKLIHDNRQAISYLRETGRVQILRRLEMIRNNDELPNDILTVILKTLGRNFKTYFAPVTINFSINKKKKMKYLKLNQWLTNL